MFCIRIWTQIYMELCQHLAVHDLRRALGGQPANNCLEIHFRPQTASPFRVYTVQTDLLVAESIELDLARG